MLYRLWALLCLITLLSRSAAQPPTRFAVIIDELFPDPSPVIGLPNSEFIELKNVSTIPCNLRNWKLSDGSSTATISSSFILQPDSFVIICSNSAAPSFTSFGKTIGVSNFPSLNNDADIITLYSAEGITVHTVSYSVDWYQNAIKSDGGWSLEMIDTKNPCTGINNWKASENPSGGTPGRKNSIDGNNPDELPPTLVRSYSLDSSTLVAVFDESLDSIQASNTSNYSIDNNTGNPISVTPIGPLFKEVLLKFSVAFNSNKIYELTVKNVTDCSGNTIGILRKTKTGIPSTADSLDIILNEILFNPPTGGFDYVELYNRGNKIIDLQHLYLANRNISGTLTNIKQLSTSPYLFFPGEYIVMTENRRWLERNYVIREPGHIIELTSLPSLPDDKGTIVLANVQEAIIDELQYDEKWHFALVNNREGVALERINYSLPTNEKSNWTSAASTVGYGTPTYQNSQFRADLQVQGFVNLAPKLFSPDNDGVDDFVLIQYQLNDPGYAANITVFDVNGRPVRYLVRNAILGLQGNFRWDGLDDKLQPLPRGAYIVLTEIFNLQGKTRKFKNVITLVRKY